jgi:hypothetical protein
MKTLCKHTSPRSSAKFNPWEAVPGIGGRLSIMDTPIKIQETEYRHEVPARGNTEMRLPDVLDNLPCGRDELVLHALLNFCRIAPPGSWFPIDITRDYPLALAQNTPQFVEALDWMHEQNWIEDPERPKSERRLRLTQNGLEKAEEVRQSPFMKNPFQQYLVRSLGH